ncbi:MAG: hypothetical protein HZB56_00860 [Deltaproteobacteria bacterium]|nr:hypothetical protein [Deltaproteobacteria bacterium]
MTLFLIVGLVTGGYLLVVWAPIWVVHYEVKHVVRDYGNRAVKDPNDQQLVADMCAKLRSLDSSRTLAEDGRVESRPSVVVDPVEVTWQRDTAARPPELRVAFTYRRDLYYPIVERWSEVEMQVDMVMDIGLPDWGPSR